MPKVSVKALETIFRNWVELCNENGYAVCVNFGTLDNDFDDYSEVCTCVTDKDSGMIVIL